MTKTHPLGLITLLYPTGIKLKGHRIWEKYGLHSTYLYNRSTDASIEPNPVKSRNHSIARNRTKDDRAEPLPLLSEVIGMDLRKEHGQDHSQHCDQVHLTPILGWKEVRWWLLLMTRKGKCNLGFCITHSKLYWLGIFISKHDYLLFLKKKKCMFHTTFRFLRTTNQIPKWAGKKSHL